MCITTFVSSHDSILIQQYNDYTKVFENEKCWEILKLSIGLNVDCTIKNLDNENINGDTETYETKNKTDKGCTEFLKKI